MPNEKQVEKIAKELLNTCFGPDFIYRYSPKLYTWYGFLNHKITNIIDLSNPYIKSIYDDDVSLLQQLIYKNNYDIKQKIQLFGIENPMDSFNEANILGISAYFGSINCFKFILLKSDEVNYEKLLEFSISGGYYDIIHIAENGIVNPESKSNPKLLFLAIKKFKLYSEFKLDSSKA